MDLFNKKKLKDLEEECKVLKENLENKDTNMVKYQKEIDRLNNETNLLKKEINAIQKEKRLAMQNERKNLEHWIIKCKRAEVIATTFKENLDSIASYKKEFRKTRGDSLNTKSKRIKYKKQRKLEESIENIYKSLEGDENV